MKKGQPGKLTPTEGEDGAFKTPLASNEYTTDAPGLSIHAL